MEVDAIEKTQNITRSCEELLLEKRTRNERNNSSKIKFDLQGEEKDVYNITAPFQDRGKTYLAGRVEKRESEHSTVGFFVQKESTWVLDQSLPRFELQDPFVTRVEGELVLGGVEIFEGEEKGKLNYRTVFRRGNDLTSLKVFAKGPDRMKDIRLCRLSDGRILVFTRPQGEEGGRGTIGFMFLDKLSRLNEETICRAVLLKQQFLPSEWGGANELHELSNGMLGVLSHIASFDEAGNRHYYATVFCFDPVEGVCSPMKMIAERSDFEKGESKRPDLEDVIFSGGLVRLKNKKARLYCGVSDAEAHWIEIPDPFLEFETVS